MDSYLIQLESGVFIADFKFNRLTLQIKFTQKSNKFATNFSKSAGRMWLNEIIDKFPEAKLIPRKNALKQIV